MIPSSFSSDLLMRPSILLAAAFMLYSATAAAQSGFFNDFKHAAEAGQATTDVNIDNDTLLLNRRDGFYTSGARIERRYLLKDRDAATEFGWHLGQELYTPSDIKLPPQWIDPYDHPYAGWLYLGMFRNTAHSDGSHAKFGVDAGCLGPCAGGEWTQTNLHRLLHQPLPQGWSTQVRNEWGAVLFADVAPVRWTPDPSFDVTPNVHGRFGNIFTDAGVGVMLRAGRLNALPEQRTLHGYVRLDASAIGHNATLQGGYFSSGNPRVVQPKRLVGEAEIGVQWKDGAYGAQASVVRRSNEIDGLPNSVGAQSFARFVLSYTR